ncbi:MAG: hypothetical protein ACP5IE_08430 [Infirmifilum sp.]|uniref:Uncharacterized protein n=1 Tax=Fervidicoccus fontis TaxID=683846 RepID=A0A843AI20_9CREN|nr:hypothetical protein [Fervidicoccus fontis]MBE9391229.1 hypothetical protein [Fervidicoccus fontis]
MRIDRLKSIGFKPRLGSREAVEKTAKALTQGSSVKNVKERLSEYEL